MLKQSLRGLTTKTARPAPKPISNWNQPAVYVPDQNGAAEEEKPTAPFRGSLTVSVELPARSHPWEQFAPTHPRQRVRPTVSGWIPKDDRAYDDMIWSKEEDERLARVVHTTAEGLTRQWRRLAALHFPDRRPRDLRMRYQTYLQAERRSKDRFVGDASSLKKEFGPDLTAFQGRWCVIPSGRPTPEPHEAELHIQGEDMLQSVMEEGQVWTGPRLGQLSKERQQQPGRYLHSRTPREIGMTSLDVAMQSLHEAEAWRRYQLSGKLAVKKAMSEAKQKGEVLLEEVGWLQEEDDVLREAFELYGTDWVVLSRTLRARRRTPAECRERMEQLHREEAPPVAKN